MADEARKAAERRVAKAFGTTRTGAVERRLSISSSAELAGLAVLQVQDNSDQVFDLSYFLRAETAKAR